MQKADTKLTPQPVRINRRQAVAGVVAGLGSHDIRKTGARYLSDLTAWTFDDLLRLPAVGPVKAAKIEATMAKYDLALKDGDPRRYQDLPEKEPEPESRPIGGTPDEIRRACALDLVAVGQRMTQMGASMMKQGVRAATPAGRPLGGQLIRRARQGMKAHYDASAIGKVLQDLEASEATEQRLPRRRGREIVERGNVVSGVFPAAAAPVSSAPA